MAKNRNFSVYLLKTAYNPDNALKENHSLTLLKTTDTNLPEGSIMYYGQSRTTPPWWKDYWGIHQELQQTSVGAIVFIPVKNRWFALTFGTCYHKLKDTSYEYDFGLRTTLNTLDPEKIKSTDVLIPDTAKRQRIQIPNASSLTYFDFNTDESVVRRLTGAVKEEYRDLLSSATGSSSLRFSSKCVAGELKQLCARLLEIYELKDYEKSFPDIRNIIPVKDPDLIGSLKNKLLEDFQNESQNLTLCIPDIVDYSSVFKVKYRIASKYSDEFDDVHIDNY